MKDSTCYECEHHPECPQYEYNVEKYNTIELNRRKEMEIGIFSAIADNLKVNIYLH